MQKTDKQNTEYNQNQHKKRALNVTKSFATHCLQTLNDSASCVLSARNYSDNFFHIPHSSIYSYEYSYADREHSDTQNVSDTENTSMKFLYAASLYGRAGFCLP